MIKQGKANKFPACSQWLKKLGVFVYVLFMGTAVFSQNDTLPSQNLSLDSTNINHDSAANKLFNYVRKFGIEEQKKNAQEYSEDTIATKQEEIIAHVRTLMLEAQNYLENGLDTSGLNTELEKIANWYKITSDGVLTNTGTIQTHRNLETSYKIMRELLTRMVARKSALDNYYKNLVGFRNTIDSLYKDSVLYKFSSDSAVLMRYVEKLTVVSEEIKPIDTLFKRTLGTVSELQPIVNRYVNRLTSGLEQIAVFQQDLSSKTFNRETTNLGGRVKFVRPLGEIVNFSITKGLLSLIFYARNELGTLLLLLTLIIVCTAFLVKLKRDLVAQNLVEDERQQVLIRYPALSALFIVLTFFQFVFVDPPFLLTAIIWVLSAVSLTIIIKTVISRFWMFAWLALVVFFVLACADNLVLQASRPERWFMLCLSVAGIVSCSIILWMAKRNQLKERLLLFFIWFVIVLQIVSIITNFYGRYNLAKTCLTTGFFNVVLAVIFFWTLRFVKQAFVLTTKSYSIPNKKLFFINFQKSEAKAPRIFYVVLFFGWFVLFARNFYAYQLISSPVKNFILDHRTIGDFSFSIGNLLEFFFILYISGLVSRTVSFIAGRQNEPGPTAGKGGIGSWLLIIRITITIIGLLVAFAVVGIPMDRLTIILSALSVGVGFGLQTLVNNLVSGLIISFEKPVSVGDIVEVGSQSGTVKSIGFRSSIISTITGAEVVIPNGDLLNLHLVNWTHDNISRAVEIPVGVAYGTDLKRAIRVLKELPVGDERILSVPAPSVIIKQFNNSTIDMQLTFWVKNIRQWTAVKTDVILAIDRAFLKNSISIPLPQQEVHIRSFSDDDEEELTKPELNQD
jgi:potassium-dependent mechanosensitive channel